MSTAATPPRLSTLQVLACAGLLVTLSMGIRHGFGLFNLPITQAHGWSRTTFALTIALQNLVWGAMQPFAGALADRFGALWIMVAGALLYVGGLVVMAFAQSGLTFVSGAGLLIGLAQAGTTYSIVYGVIGRQVDPAKRSWAMGVAAAAGSFGQFAMIPVAQSLIGSLGAQQALLWFAVAATLMLPLAFSLREPKPTTRREAAAESTLSALAQALRQRNFRLLMLSYFVCGFQVVFIGVHLAPYLQDQAAHAPAVGAPVVATIALALVGLFNVFGTYGAGMLGQHRSRARLLAGIYTSRAALITVFLLWPLSPWSTWAFAAAIGVLWLSTVPLTNMVIVQIFGTRHLSMLSGIVFLAHQVGSFLGAWLGGYLFDATGSYTPVWLIAIGLGVLAATICLRISERPLALEVA